MALTDNGKYVIFPEIEEAKANLTMKTISQAISKGFKHKYKYPTHPKMMILNATYAGVALAKLALKAGYEVTIADNDAKYLETLRQSLSKVSKSINVCDYSKYFRYYCCNHCGGYKKWNCFLILFSCDPI